MTNWKRKEKSDSYSDRVYVFDNNETSYYSSNSIYAIDENSDGVTDYAFADPDFKGMDLKSNLVLRWEYKPGSTLFLVWSQNRNGNNPKGKFNMEKDMNDLFDIYPYNVFLIKFSYRFRV